MAVEISASQFKARCLAILDDVSQAGAEVIVTKRGVPVARIVPVESDVSLIGTVKQLVDDEELIAPLDEPWEALLPGDA